MRQKRAKAYKRLMNLYAQNFGFRSPFQVLVGQDFLLEQSNKQLDLSKMLSNCVQGECKPMITQCSMEALYKLGKEYQNVTNLAKTFERRRCNHREPIEEHLCIKDVVGETNKHRYVLAVQNKRLRSQLRMVPAVPICHFNERGVMVMEVPSEATAKAKDAIEAEKLKTQLDHQAPLLENIIGGDSTTEPTEPLRKRKSGPKAPNPLSQRKRKDEAPEGRLSKKQLAAREAEAVAAAYRGKKRARGEDQAESEAAAVEGMDKEEPVRSTVPLATTTQTEQPLHESTTARDQVAEQGGENEGAHKKRKRKRRKKGPEDAEGGDLVADDDE